MRATKLINMNEDKKLLTPKKDRHNDHVDTRKNH